MKTGMNRPIDELGRVVIPKEIRNSLDIKPKDELEISIEDGAIILRKCKNNCVLCGGTDNLLNVDGRNLCKRCIEKINAITK